MPEINGVYGRGVRIGNSEVKSSLFASNVFSIGIQRKHSNRYLSILDSMKMSEAQHREVIRGASSVRAEANIPGLKHKLRYGEVRSCSLTGVYLVA